MSGAEGQDPAGTDPIDLPRGATSSGTPQPSTPSVTRLIDTKSLLQVTPYHGDKASFLGWKWSSLIAVRAISKPLYEEFEKIEDNINQDFRKSRLTLESVTGNQHSRHQTHASIFDNGTKMLRSTRHEPVNA